jgi:ribosome-associated protein
MKSPVFYFAIVCTALSAHAWVPSPNAHTHITKIINPTTRTAYTILNQAKNNGKTSRETKKTVDDLIDFMHEPMEEMVDTSYISTGPVADDDLAPLVKIMASAADKRKAMDIVAMRVNTITTMTGFIVVCTGNSRPQNQAIAGAIREDVDEEFGSEYALLGNGVPEGDADSGWIVLDYGDVMVHIMTPKSRLFYDIEGQWNKKGGEYLDLTSVLVPNSVVGEAESATDGRMEGISEEDDPFWS